MGLCSDVLLYRHGAQHNRVRRKNLGHTKAQRLLDKPRSIDVSLQRHAKRKVHRIVLRSAQTSHRKSWL